MNLKLTFSGGCEALCDGKAEHRIQFSEDEPTIESLLQWILQNIISDPKKSSLLIVDGDIRPGILVLINDTDWEITGGLATKLNEGDEISFISTLHGG